VLLKKVFKQSWDIFLENMRLFIGVFSAMFLVSIIMGILSPKTDNGLSFQFIIFRVAANLFSMGLTLGSIKIILDVIAGKSPKMNDLFNKFDLLIPYVLSYLTIMVSALLIFIPISSFMLSEIDIVSILRLLVSGEITSALQELSYGVNYAPLFLFISLCFYMWIRIQFYPYLIVSQELGPLESLKKSYMLTENYVLDLVVFIFCLIAVNLLGLLALGLGLFITIPYSLISTCIMFNYLSETKGQDSNTSYDEITN